jgi:hypothetical protein
MNPEWSTFSEGLAGACQKVATEPQQRIPDGSIPDSLCGYIGKTGDWIVPARYMSVQAFHDGLAAVRETGEPGFKYIDRTGQKAIPGPFRSAGSFPTGRGSTDGRQSGLH